MRFKRIASSNRVLISTNEYDVRLESQNSNFSCSDLYEVGLKWKLVTIYIQICHKNTHFLSTFDATSNFLNRIAIRFFSFFPEIQYVLRWNSLITISYHILTLVRVHNSYFIISYISTLCRQIVWNIICLEHYYYYTKLIFISLNFLENNLQMILSC